MKREWDNLICYRVYQEKPTDSFLVADIHFDPSILEKGFNTPVGLTANEITKMMYDLIDILRAMDTTSIV